MPDVPRSRAPVEKSHYRLQIDFEVRADTLEAALTRLGMVFRLKYRKKLREGLVYMGAYSAQVRHVLKPTRSRHPVVSLKKGLPIDSGMTHQEVVAEREEAETAAVAKMDKKKGSQAPVTDVPSVAEQAQAPAITAPEPSPKRRRKSSGISLASFMGGGDD